MKFVRFKTDNYAYGVLENDEISIYQGDIYTDAKPTGKSVALKDVDLLPPCTGNFFALWNNSRAQIEKLDREIPDEALFFMKPSSAFLTHGQTIVYPKGQSERVVLEGELGIVIGKACKNVTAEQAQSHIFGYTIVNDVTAQDIVKRDSSYPQYVRAKGFDTFGVFGPVIETNVDLSAIRIQSFINGKICQDFMVTDLIFNPYEIVADLSRTMTLKPGDIIACGTSLGVESIVPGDTVEIRIDGVGSLINPVQ